jgi:alkylhydroperoxidase family enzyme
VAGAVLRGDDSDLTEAERALAAWARAVARDPNATRPDDVSALRDAGYTDRQIFALTLYVSLRVAFSSVNDALGARPDAELVERASDPVRAAVTFGRPAATAP